MKITLDLMDANKYLPARSGKYLALTNNDNWTTLDYSHKNQAFNVDDGYTKEEAVKMAINVEYWAEMPVLENCDHE